MKNIKHIGFVSFIWMLLCIGAIMYSCKKDNNAGSNQVVLFSFGPAGLNLGDTLSFIGENLNQVSAIKFVGDSVTKTGFLSQSSTLIKLVIPQTAKTGYVTLYYPNGKLVTATVLDFLVPVTITAWQQSARPLDTIFIDGTNLTWVNSIVFPNGIKDSVFVSKTDNQIRAIVPLKTVQGFLTIYTGGTKPLTIVTDTVFTPILPVITSFTPTTVFPSNPLTITGTNLDLVYGIIFKGATDTIFASQFTSISKTQIQLTMPSIVEDGTVTLVSISRSTSISSMILNIGGGLPILPALAFPIYDYQLENSAVSAINAWSWGEVAQNDAESDTVRNGLNYAIFVQYAGNWGALGIGGFNAAGSYTTLQFSIYGSTGSDGNVITIQLNGAGSTYNYTVQAGQWEDVTIPLTSFGSPSPITKVTFQENGWAGKVYFDRIGFN